VSGEGMTAHVVARLTARRTARLNGDAATARSGAGGVESLCRRLVLKRIKKR
jgi:hypothetical protein